MSVINETLENLKQPKKRPTGTFNPSSSAYCDKILKTEKILVSKRACMISASFAVLVGLLFYCSHLFFAHGRDTGSEKPSSKRWFAASHIEATAPSSQSIDKPTAGTNVVAQKMYYDALTLLNEGNEEQALQRLSDIMSKYPDFAPAKQAYHATIVN